jgi:hypothetical protein
MLHKDFSPKRKGSKAIMMTRKDYVATAEILNYVSDKTHPAVFSKMVNDFAEMFAKDNDRFDVVKFHEASNYRVPKFTSN